MVDRAETTSTTLSSPHIESMLAMFGPKLTGILGGNIQTDAFAPSVAAQNQAQQQAMKTALGQQGFTYDPTSGAVGGSGIAAFQPYLDRATTAANQIQGAGATALTNAQAAMNQMQGLAGAQAISGAATPYQQQAMADLAGARGLAGPGAGTGAGSIDSYIDPQRQAYIDAELAAYDQGASQRIQDLRLNQGQMGVFGGTRAAQAQIAQAQQDQLNRNLLSGRLEREAFMDAAGRRQQDISNRMGISQQTGALGQAASGYAGQDIGALQQAGTAQGQLAGSQMSPFQNALAAQTQLAGDVGRLGAQQFGVLSSFGDQQQKYAQAGIDAMANRNKLQQYAPYEQLGFVGQQISGLMGGYGTGTTVGSTQGPQPSSGESLASGLMSTSGILANLGSLFGQG
tara:strand:- start:290 stop:1486 length:1197 start_codon:yes stop_codon:yes gene_type:complete